MSDYHFKIVKHKKKPKKSHKKNLSRNVWISCKSQDIKDIEFGSNNFINPKERIEIPLKCNKVKIWVKKNYNMHLFDKENFYINEIFISQYQNPIAFDVFCILWDLFSPYENPLPILRGIYGHIQILFKSDRAFKIFKNRIELN
jgi:hypothetical protein